MSSGSASKTKSDDAISTNPFTRMKSSKNVSHDKMMAIIDIGQRYLAQELERLDVMLQLDVDVRGLIGTEFIPQKYIGVLKNCTFRANTIRAQLEVVKKLAMVSAGSITGKNTTDGKDLATALVNAAKEKLRAKFSSPDQAEYVEDDIAPRANSGG